MTSEQPPPRRSKAAIIVGVAVAILVAGGLLFRTPLRKMIKHSFTKKEEWHGLFQNPEGLAIDSEGNLYVGDQDTSTLFMLDRAGKVLAKWREVEGYTDGEGRSVPPTRGLNIVAIEPRHIVMVCRHNVAEFEIAGDRAKVVRLIGSRGSDPGQMDGPEGMSRDANGDLYVTDEHNRRINIYDKDGKFLRFWPLRQDPQCVRVWDDRVYVCLNKRNYISCRTREGVEQFRIGHEAMFPVFLWTAGLAAPAAGLVLFLLRRRRWAIVCVIVVLAIGGLSAIGDWLFHNRPGEFHLPDSMCPSPDGTSLYITDRTGCRIQVFDPEGRFKFCFGAPGSKPGEFADPKDLAFDLDGNLLVADSDNHRIQVFTPDGKFVRSIE